jgi:hypothetical protein
MADRDDRNWFYVCYYVLIGIGVAVFVYFSTPDILKRLSPYIESKWLLPLMGFAGGCAVVGFAAYFTTKHYQQAGITPTKEQKIRFLQSPVIPLWVKLLHITGVTAMLLAVGGAILGWYNVPILPGVLRVWDRGILPWILLLGGFVVLVVVRRIPQKYRRATKSNYDRQTVQLHPGLDEFPAWAVTLGLMSLTAMGAGIWMIAAAFFK